MPYSLPVFNLEAGIYTGPGGTTLRSVVACNLAWGKRTNSGGTTYVPPTDVPFLLMTLLLPPLTDIRGPLSTTGADTVVVPFGSGRTYLVIGVDDLGKGFENEHRGAVIIAKGTQPTPLP